MNSTIAFFTCNEPRYHFGYLLNCEQQFFMYILSIVVASIAVIITIICMIFMIIYFTFLCIKKCCKH
jgi:hypothetical protein